MRFVDRAALLAAIDATVNNSPDPDSGLRVIERYGREECLAVAADVHASIMAVLINLAVDHDRDLATGMVEAMRTDVLGMGQVAYFPGFRLAGEATCG